MSDGPRVTGRLPVGVLVDGVRHRDFELRLPTVQDNIEVVDEVGSTNGVAVNAALLARQLVRLGTLAPKQISFDLVCGLLTVDFNELDGKANELLGKLKAELVAEETSSSAPASPSADSA